VSPTFEGDDECDASFLDLMKPHNNASYTISLYICLQYYTSTTAILHFNDSNTTLQRQQYYTSTTISLCICLQYYTSTTALLEDPVTPTFEDDDDFDASFLDLVKPHENASVPYNFTRKSSKVHSTTLCRNLVLRLHAWIHTRISLRSICDVSLHVLDSRSFFNVTLTRNTVPW
jgi:hypothetical protein